MMHDEILNGVKCTVSECYYNSDSNYCTAKSIEVNQSTNDCTCSQNTQCETFKQK